MATNFDFSETNEVVFLTFYKAPKEAGNSKNEIPVISLKNETTLVYNNEEISLFAPVEYLTLNSDSNLKTEVSLKKKTSKKWNSIDGNVGKVIVHDEIYKEEPEDRDKMDLMNLFKDLYSKGDENTKRAMNKSLEESAGTVLSTNWESVKQKKVTPEK